MSMNLQCESKYIKMMGRLKATSLCLVPISISYIMLYIVLAYLMLFAALTNAVCLYNASFFAIDFCKCSLFSCSVFVFFVFVFI